MGEKLLFGKVVLVTGAGRGVGRDIALSAAEQGASVVVNDLGGGTDGQGTDDEPAAAVVREIEGAGGAAIANYGSVADFDTACAMVDQAVSEFGRLDMVVNNAGILRDGIFHKMSEADFDAVIGVHLKGAFNVSRAAAPLFRSQESGAYVHMTSTSGLIGNFGQANYAAAKLGIVGLSKSISLDMARFKVRSNCISPFAWSRLIGTIPNDPTQQERLDKIKQMKPAKIAPVVIALGSDAASHVTGQIFAVRNNEIFLMSQSRPLRGMHQSDGWTAKDVLERAFPAMQSDFYDLDRSADVFSWDPV